MRRLRDSASEGLSSKVADLEALLKQERALVDELRDELERIIRDRRHTQITVDLLLAERRETRIAISHEDAADLQFLRAEYELRAKEQASVEVNSLRREVAELRKILADYQAVQRDTAQPAPSPRPSPWRSCLQRWFRR